MLIAMVDDLNSVDSPADRFVGHDLTQNFENVSRPIECGDANARRALSRRGLDLPRGLLDDNWSVVCRHIEPDHSTIKKAG
ncbi:MAG: hypothetical protein FWD63_03790 [Propionibacteriaceae bacterium]|nr:hypothetical protein [Propionibacteriaceae bacterium]